MGHHVQPQNSPQQGIPSSVHQQPDHEGKVQSLLEQDAEVKCDILENSGQNCCKDLSA